MTGISAIARGRGEIHAYGAKAFASVPEFANGTGVRVSLSPAQESLPTLTDADEREIANDFQSKLLRYRMVNHRACMSCGSRYASLCSGDARGGPRLACADLRLSGFAKISH